MVDSGNILFGLKKQQYVEYTLSFCKKIEKKLSNFEELYTMKELKNVLVKLHTNVNPSNT